MQKEKINTIHCLQEDEPEKKPANHDMTVAASHYHLRIVLKEKDYFIAFIEQREVRLSTAISCLIQPQIGDLVVSSIPQNGTQGYILAVLERSGDSVASELVLPGDATITAPDGGLSIQAKQQITLNSNEKIGIKTQQFENNAEKVCYNNKEFILSGEKLRANYANSYWICHEDFMIKTLRYQLHCKNSLRQITGHEETLSQSFRQYVENNWTLHTRSTAMYADETTSIKAEMLKLA